MHAFGRDSVQSPPVGEAPTFEEMFSLYYPLVQRVAMRFTDSPDDAEDLTQEVFTKVWKKLDDFQFNSSLKTWIYRIAVNTCIDYTRRPWKRARRRSRALDESVDPRPRAEMPASSLTAEGKLLAEENAALLRKALTSLKPHLRAVIVLKDLEGMSYEEMSAILGVSLGTISSRLNRARKALQESFQAIGAAVQRS